MMMNEDPEMAKNYQEKMAEIKNEKESIYNNLERIQTQYDDFYRNKINKEIRDSIFEQPRHNQKVEDEILSTEFEDAGENALYAKYKAYKEKRTIELKDADRKLKNLKQELQGATRPRDRRAIQHMIEDLYTTRQEKNVINVQLDELVAKLRFRHEMKKVERDVGSMIDKKDPLYGHKVSLDSQHSFGAEDNVALPDWLRHSQTAPMEFNRLGGDINSADYGRLTNEDTALLFDLENEHVRKYWMHKMNHFYATNMKNLKITYKQLEVAKQHMKYRTDFETDRVEFMYENSDYYNDRT